MCEAGYTVLLQGASEWIWMRGLLLNLFKQAGYATVHSASGIMECSIPTIRSVGDLITFMDSVPDIGGHYYDALMERNGKLVQGKGFCVDDFTTDAMSFIERSVNKEKPFFVYIPYNTPHSPMQVPDRWWNKFKDKKLEDMMRHRNPGKEDRLHLLAALAMCENIDWNVGRLLKKLDQLEATDDTIVVFFHDNGPNGNRLER
jgi:hypothetical protein